MPRTPDCTLLEGICDDSGEAMDEKGAAPLLPGARAVLGGQDTLIRREAGEPPPRPIITAGGQILVGIAFDRPSVMPNIQDACQQGGAAPRFVVVVWVGPMPPRSLITTLERAGIGVILSRDIARTSVLLAHFRPSAFLSPSLEDLLSIPDQDAPLILVDGPRDSDVPPHVRQVPASAPDAVARAVHLGVRARDEHATPCGAFPSLPARRERFPGEPILRVVAP